MIQFDTPIAIRGSVVDMHFECIDALVADPNACYRLYGIGGEGYVPGTVLKHNGKLVEIRTIRVDNGHVKHIKMH